ncbi:AGE family epimerase/isomerase [Maribacter sp. PR1]|uniref:AGE family epimerase/isomerase n=1 Tax=Maribacter cobaltidurans TaxID=1178778 RepID=A0ABU7IQR6_9FLAO|nr:MULTISPECIES: AGE family epimerase/isomerase [Maribacter]MDC6387918.1 AGE family epimerase/isomerase [Maribacter sp. PR1]MEE1975307.1 AGE family epimerase/isomerase [Maribacter cobaltidurans]
MILVRTYLLRNSYPFLVLFVLLLSFSCTEKATKTTDTKKELLSEFEASLDTLSNVWYPKTIDSTNGGFWSDFDYKWDKVGPQNKMLVSQARHVWTASTLALYYDDPNYERIAKHGFEFLRDEMWDEEHGGFHTLLGISGDSLQLLSSGKSAYGNSFAIYGLATYYKVSKDTAALNMAKKTFQWLEEHAHDPENGGYFDVLQMDGSWMLEVTENDNTYDNFIRKDWKDQNSSIHLMESFTALYEVWPNALVKERLEELFLLIRDTITTEIGYLTLHLQRDWTPVSYKDSTEAARKENFFLDHVSFGHDVETAFLLLETSHVLGKKQDSVTMKKTKKMVDHALDWGWDDAKGGFYEGGYYWDNKDRTIEDDRKVWWTQAECLNTLLLLSKLYPEEPKYYELFEKQWHYIQSYLLDQTYGGWYDAGLDTSPEAKKRAKAQIWKVNYHNTRSLINVIKMMKDEFELTDTHE